MGTDRRIVTAVVWFLGLFALIDLVAVGILVGVVLVLGVKITAELMALFALLANPMSAALAAVGTVLASTRTTETPTATPPPPPPSPGDQMLSDLLGGS